MCVWGSGKVPWRVFSRDVTRAQIFGPLDWDAFPNSASLSSSCGFGEGGVQAGKHDQIMPLASVDSVAPCEGCRCDVGKF